MNIWQRWLKQPQRTFLRRALFQIHLWTGLIIGLYVVAVCVSGSAIVFRGEFSANGVFPNLTFTPDEEKNEVVLMTGLVRAKLV